MPLKGEYRQLPPSAKEFIDKSLREEEQKMDPKLLEQLREIEKKLHLEYHYSVSILRDLHAITNPDSISYLGLTDDDLLVLWHCGITTMSAFFRALDTGELNEERLYQYFTRHKTADAVYAIFLLIRQSSRGDASWLN